ncbi:MAG: Lar family restriction alleviation protein [Eggerthellaceae bacterium]|nr:Lar family restriction alleviation protein [Eggerthellaceae bacterium]
MTELKPCPFCGGEAKIRMYRTFIDEYHGIGTKYYVECSECLVNRHLGKLTENEAIEAWNTRAERTCTNVYAGREFECSECGMQWHLLDREDEMEEWAHVRKPSYCPSCGAKVVK